jgi:hypothetical protein
MVEKIGFFHFDLAILGYQIATVLFLIGCVYRFVVWLRYPPNRTLWQRGARGLQDRGMGANLATLIVFGLKRLLFQTFIVQRGWLRWVTHLAIVWGMLIVCALCFALAWGMTTFTLVDQGTYIANMLGMPLVKFNVDSVIAWLMFNSINLGSLLLLAGLLLALWQRYKMRPLEKAQRLGDQRITIYLLLAVTVSGLLLAVSYKFLHGVGHRQLAVLHEVLVVLGLICLPFSKLFHVLVSPAGIALDVAEESAMVEPSRCSRCDQTLSAVWMPGDFSTVLASAGVRRSGDSPDPAVLTLCPSCRRHGLAGVLSGKELPESAERK